MSVEKNICPFLTLSKHVRFPSHSDLTSPFSDPCSVVIIGFSHLMSIWFSVCRRTCSTLHFSGLWLRFLNSWDEWELRILLFDAGKLIERKRYRYGRRIIAWSDWVIALPVFFYTTFSKRKQNTVRLTSHDWEVEGSDSCRYLRGDYVLKLSSIYFLSLFSPRLLAHRKHPLSTVFSLCRIRLSASMSLFKF